MSCQTTTDSAVCLICNGTPQIEEIINLVKLLLAYSIIVDISLPECIPLRCATELALCILTAC